MPDFRPTIVILSYSEYFALTSDSAMFRHAIEEGEQDMYLDIILNKQYISEETKNVVLKRIKKIQSDYEKLKHILEINNLPI